MLQKLKVSKQRENVNVGKKVLGKIDKRKDNYWNWRERLSITFIESVNLTVDHQIKPLPS